MINFESGRSGINCMRKFIILWIGLSAFSIFSSACSKEDNAPTPPGAKVLTWTINKETAVRERGGYLVYIGTRPGFAEGEEVKKIDVKGNSITGSTATVSLSELAPGQYYAKIKAYSDLIDPYTGQASVSTFSDEVSFVIR